ncbi:hypothetical protein EDB84DRAFT_1440700 [Lactarius hengduanensis]|nr:hypothetical protein EDB84DRAFT_1440700 [Lactarius hengduanensis]
MSQDCNRLDLYYFQDVFLSPASPSPRHDLPDVPCRKPTTSVVRRRSARRSPERKETSCASAPSSALRVAKQIASESPMPATWVKCGARLHVASVAVGELAPRTPNESPRGRHLNIAVCYQIGINASFEDIAFKIKQRLVEQHLRFKFGIGTSILMKSARRIEGRRPMGPWGTGKGGPSPGRTARVAAQTLEQDISLDGILDTASILRIADVALVFRRRGTCSLIDLIMGLEAATKALLNACNVLPSHHPSPTRVHSRPSLVGPGIDSVEAAFVGYVYGALGTNTVFPDRPSPMGPLLGAADRASPDSKPAQNHKHSVNNPYAQFRAGHDGAAVFTSPQISNELTKLENQAIELVATGLATDYLDAFAGRSAMDTDKIFAQAGASRDDVGVVELHDCFAANELVTYAALGLCTVDDAHRFVERRDNTVCVSLLFRTPRFTRLVGSTEGSTWSTRAVDSGLTVATGLAMHFSITSFIRYLSGIIWANVQKGPMQSPGLFDLADARGKYGLVHIGLGGAVIVSFLRRPDFYHADGPDGRDRLGYNHAHELRTITRADVDKVRSKSHSKGYCNLQSCEAGPIDFLERLWYCYERLMYCTTLYGV